MSPPSKRTTDASVEAAPIASDAARLPQRTTRAPSRPKIADELAIPAAWLDRLLEGVCAPAADAGLEPTIKAFLEALGSACPDFAFGVWVPGAGRFGGPLVVIGNASTSPPRTGSPRLFPTALHEYIVALHDSAGTSLHAAHADASALTPGSLHARFFERAGLALASALRRARVAEATSAQGSELRQLHEQVIQSEKLASLGQIAAGVVHELNNPLSSIVAYSDYLRRKAERGPLDTDDVERLRRISEAADRILRFSRDLVAYARPSSGITEAVSLHDVIDQALVFCEHVFAKCGATVERDFTDRLGFVRGVAGELTQVFVNLFTNACHAMPEHGGHLIVRTIADGDMVRVHIIDNGHGIEDRFMPRIFEPFFTTKSEGRGTGLGLSIVRNIVARHDGAIRVESEHSKGTQFVLSLPAATSGRGSVAGAE